MNVIIVTSITADQASRKWTPAGKSQVLIQTAEVRGRNSGRNNILILLLYDLCSPEYNFVDKPHEKQVLYEGHTHRVIRLEKRIRLC